MRGELVLLTLFYVSSARRSGVLDEQGFQGGGGGAGRGELQGIRGRATGVRRGGLRKREWEYKQPRVRTL